MNKTGLFKIRRNTGNKVIRSLAFALALSLAAPAAAQAKAVTTPEASLPSDSDVGQITVAVNGDKGVRNFTIFGQHKKPWKKDKYLALHGCAVSSLTTVLSGYTKKYRNYTPQKVRDVVEKKVFGTAVWNKNYSKTIMKQMPVSMYGISRVLESVGIDTKYVRTFTNKSARKEIKKHLKTGNVVVIETNNRTQHNGRFSSKTTTRWSRSKHTMVLLGLTDTGKVIVADSSQRKWSGQNQRIKYTTVKEIVKYMIPCTSSVKTHYFSSTANSGGYVLVNPQD